MAITIQTCNHCCSFACIDGSFQKSKSTSKQVQEDTYTELQKYLLQSTSVKMIWSVHVTGLEVTGSYHFQKPVKVEFERFVMVTACDQSFTLSTVNL